MEETLVKITVPTAVFQDLVLRASKGSSCNEKLLLTTLTKIDVVNNVMTLTTTDNINQMSVFADVNTSDFNAVVPTKLLSAITAKLTTPLTSLTIEGNKLLITANGQYNIPLAFDVDGSKIEFSAPVIVSGQPEIHVLAETIKSILSLNKSCKAETKEVPALFNYYFDSERALTTDFYRVCLNPVQLFDHPVCVAPSTMELLPFVSDDNGITITTDGENVMFTSTLGRLCTKLCPQEEVDEYAVEGILKSLEETQEYSCKINRTLLINAIDRLCLFVDSYNSNRLDVTFTNESIKLHTAHTDSSEVIKYLNELDPNTRTVSLAMDALFLKTELSACNTEDLIIKFGSENGILILCDKVTLMLGVLG